MSKTQSNRFYERSLETFVDDRLNILNLSTTTQDFLTSAEKCRIQKVVAFYQGQFLRWFGGAIMCLATYLMVFARGLPILVFAICLAAFACSFVMIRFGFGSKFWKYYLGLNGLQKIQFNHQEEFRAVFATVIDNKDMLVLLAHEGTGKQLTPLSHLPIETYFSARAFDNPCLALELFKPADIKHKFLVISPEPSGDWFNYYIWNEPVSKRIGEIFDAATSIYSSDLVKRHKARIAVTTIAKFVTDNKRCNKKFQKKDVVVNEFTKVLKLEASRLRKEGAINELQEMQLYRINISGEKPSSDPIDTEGKKRQKPESWFLNLMSGDYPAILGALEDAVFREFGTLPSFVK
jgi:hypothetical protein